MLTRTTGGRAAGAGRGRGRGRRPTDDEMESESEDKSESEDESESEDDEMASESEESGLEEPAVRVAAITRAVHATEARSRTAAQLAIEHLSLIHI